MDISIFHRTEWMFSGLDQGLIVYFWVSVKGGTPEHGWFLFGFPLNPKMGTLRRDTPTYSYPWGDMGVFS